MTQELDNRALEWTQSKTSDAAEELVWASTVFGPSNSTSAALAEISNEERFANNLRESAGALINRTDLGQFDLVLDSLASRKVIAKQIRLLREKIVWIPNNPILYVELARLHNRLGQLDKTRKFFRIARNLAPTSRYVLRAAARFFVHVEEFDRAADILSKGDPNDPWIQASRISVSDLAGIPVRGVKRTRSILDTDVEPRHLSELAGSLGTLEFGAGNLSKAKKYFKTGAIDPNDNMIAQLYWASKNKAFEFPEELLHHSLTYEARTSFARKAKRWKEAIGHCAEWLQDESFSLRPAQEGSYIAAELLQDYQKAIEFCEAGLIANPLDFGLLNNMAFSYIGMGDYLEAEKYIELAKTRTESAEDEIYLSATRGMLCFRRGQVEVGAKTYLAALQQALELKDRGLAQQAAVHYYLEYARLGNFLSGQEVEKIIKLMNDRRITEDARDIYEMALKPLLMEATKLNDASAAQSSVLERVIE